MTIGDSLLICLTAYVALLGVLRRTRVSYGLPFAYLSALLLIHVPGAFAHLVGGAFLLNTDTVALGIHYAAIGAAAFVVGVWLAQRRAKPCRTTAYQERRDFSIFCVVGGWLFIYGITPMVRIPSIGAAVEKAGAIWMLGVLLGLRAAIPNRDVKWIVVWTAALLVYPVLMLVLGGFVSYGSTAIIIVCSVLAVSTRRYWRVAIGIALAALVGLNVFTNYFRVRGPIRDVVWSDAGLGARVRVVGSMFTDFQWFDPRDQEALTAADERLNQNYFVGLAASRIDDGEVDYLRGRSLREALEALVPRLFWPEKPVYAGSPAIVSEMTGLQLSKSTSFGVGNVMEFEINFGTPGVIGGFLILGLLLGTLDRNAAQAEARGDLGTTILCFLPAVSLIQPNGSLIELAGGSAAALVAAMGWSWLWAHRERRASAAPTDAPVAIPAPPHASES